MAYDLSIGTKLGDLEWGNRLNGCVISPNSVAFWADCVAEDIYGNFLRQECRPNNVVFNDILFMAILAGHHPKR